MCFSLVVHSGGQIVFDAKLARAIIEHTYPTTRLQADGLQASNLLASVWVHGICAMEAGFSVVSLVVALHVPSSSGLRPMLLLKCLCARASKACHGGDFETRGGRNSSEGSHSAVISVRGRSRCAEAAARSPCAF